MIRFNFTKHEISESPKWIQFYPHRNKGTGFNFTYSTNGYHDPRPYISTNITTLIALTLPWISILLVPISLILCFYSWGSIYINLPFDTGRGDTSEYNTYGLLFYHHDSGFPNQFWVRGFNKLSFYFPWTYDYLKAEYLFKDGWRKEERGDNFWDIEKWADQIVYETYDYQYTLQTGVIQNRKATIHQVKRYWSRWFGLHIKSRWVIEIEFNEEVGERSGSWKGGVTGCSYEIRPGETALACLRRMESERKF